MNRPAKNPNVMPSYEPRYEIERVKRFNDNYFERFHLEWAFGHLPGKRHRYNLLHSATIDAGIEDTPQCWDYPLQWQFEIGWDDEALYVCLESKGTKYHGHTTPLFIARTMLSSKSTGLKLYGNARYNTSYDMEWTIPVETANQSAVDFVLHCWLDVREVVGNTSVDASLANRRAPIRNGRSLLSMEMATLFDEIDHQSEMSTSDVVLITKEDDGKTERRFYCHRTILCARSIVFKSMLAGGKFAEAHRGFVNIDDIDANTMRSVLKHIYTAEFEGNVSESKDRLIQLMNAAEKYGLRELVEECAFRFVETYVEDTDYVELLRFAEMYRLNWAKRICILALSTNMDELWREESMGMVSNEAMLEFGAIYVDRMLDTKEIEVMTDKGRRW